MLNKLVGTKGLAKAATIRLLGLPPGSAADPVVVKPGQTRTTIRIRTSPIGDGGGLL